MTMEIFHYCNLSKFERILNSKKLWLTPVQIMKDGKEVNYLYEEIWPKVKKKIFNETQVQFRSNLQSIFSLIDNNSKLRTGLMPFCACFSNNGDLSAQWRDYADDGTGVSIGFDFDYFKIQSIPPHPNININNAIGLGTVVYDGNSQILGLYSIAKQELSLEPPNPQTWITILKNLTIYSALFKDIYYLPEQEKRIIYYFDDQHTNQLTDSFLSGPYDYEYKISGYFRFELRWFTSDWNHAITKIYLGPKCEQSTSDVLKLLNQFGINIKENQILEAESS